MVAVGLFLFGCASVKDVEILDKEADRLYAQNDANRKDVESLKREFAALRQEIQRDLATFQKENQNQRADLSLRIDTPNPMCVIWCKERMCEALERA
jgi:hypothetical protein